MANEITVPLLPCRDIDDIVEFYSMLGFTRTYYQALPNPYVALKREDIQLHFFGIPDFNPEDSYGSCLVIVRDTGELYRAFAEGIRAARGKLLVSGIPRMTRPRKRKNADNHSGFTVIDPAGTGSGSRPPRPSRMRRKQCRASLPSLCRTQSSWATPTATTCGRLKSSTPHSNGTRTWRQRPTCSKHWLTEPNSRSAWTTPQERQAPSPERAQSRCPKLIATSSPRLWPAWTTWRPS